MGYYSNDYLMHYGIKGMKWGVRRFQNKDGSLTPAGKKRYPDDDVHDGESETNDDSKRKKLTTKQKVAIGASAVGVAMLLIGAKYVYSKSNMPTHFKTYSFGKKIDLDSLSTSDTVLRRGTKLHRISSKSVEDYAGEGKRIYVSYLRKDKRIYKETMPGFINRWRREGFISDGGKSVYEHVMKTKTEIKIPSKRTMAEMYMEATMSKDIDQARYQAFMSNLNDRDNHEVRKFFELVKSRGYNAVIDENDAGNFTKSPLIILNPNDVIERSRSHRVTALERFINVVLM